jgi:hypothetical protein
MVVVQCDAKKNKGGTEVTDCTKCNFVGKEMTCLACAEGKFLKEKTPGKKDYECLSCKDAGPKIANCGECRVKDPKAKVPAYECVRCAKNFFLKADASACQKCEDTAGMMCGAGVDCDARHGCKTCGAGFTLVSAKDVKNPKRMKCLDCVKGGPKIKDCGRCTETKCIACAKGKAMSIDGKSCAATFKDNKDKAVAIDIENCQGVRFGQNKDKTKSFYTCDFCKAGFYADSFGTCVDCPAGCLFCKEKGKCAMC